MHAYDAVIAGNFLKGVDKGKANAICVLNVMGLPPEQIAEAKALLEALKSKL